MDIRAVREAKKQLELITALPTAIAVQPFEKGPRYQKKEIVAKLPKGYVAIVDNKDRTRFTRMPMETLKSILITYQDQIGVKRVNDLLDKAEREGGRLYTSHPKVLEVVQRQGLTFTAEPEKPPEPEKILDEQEAKEEEAKEEEELRTKTTAEIFSDLDEDQSLITIDGVEYIHDTDSRELIGLRDLEIMGYYNIGDPPTGDNVGWTNQTLRERHERDPKYKVKKKPVMKVEPVVFPDPSPPQAPIKKPKPKYTQYPQLPPEYYWDQQYAGGGYRGEGELIPVANSEVIYKKSDNEPLSNADVVWDTGDKVLYDRNFDEIEYASIGQIIRNAEFVTRELGGQMKYTRY